MEASNSTQISTNIYNSSYLQSPNVTLSNFIKSIYQSAPFTKHLINKYDELYEEYYTKFLFNHMDMILKVNNSLNLDISLFSPFTYTIYSQYILLIYCFQELDHFCGEESKNTNTKIDIINLLNESFTTFANEFQNKLTNTYLSFDLKTGNEIKQDLDNLLNKIKITNKIMEQHIDLKMSFAYFNIKETFYDFDNAKISSIKLYPTSIIENYISINDNTFNSIHKEYNDLVYLIEKSKYAQTAKTYVYLLNLNSPNITLDLIDKSKSIRSFLQHFKINETLLDKIVKAFSNYVNEDVEKQKDIAKIFENYFIKYNINFNQFIVKN